MAEMLLLDSLKELRTVIDQQHLLYLELDENPRKIDQREKLESYIKEYLYLAPHDSKFTFQQTAEVLHQSARIKNNFSAYKAAVAWKAIGKYADNLISHPWRKEYRDIKLYCGFFKHEIEESLFGAELMFEAMGYRHVGQSSMILHGILDPDRITSVSKDAIVAFVECQIMKQIWETLSTHFNITWLEILEFRENHTGTPEQVIRALTYKYHLRHYQEQQFHRPQHIRNTECHLPHIDCYYAQHPGYYTHVSYPGPSYSFPPQNRYGPVISSQHLISSSPVYPPNVHSSCVPPNILKPQDVYPVNGYPSAHHYSPQYSVPHFPPNGYPGTPMMCTTPSVVPTGQLIELESSPTHNKGDACFQRFLSNSKYSPYEESIYHQDALKDIEPSLTGKAKDDGAGSWETWDYVYRNLESQGYMKNSDSQRRIATKGNRSSSSQNNSSDDIDSTIQTDVSDKMKKLNLDSNSQSKCETSSSKSYTDTDEGLKTKNMREKNKAELEKTKEPVKVRVENKSLKTSPDKIKNSNSTVTSKSSLSKQKANEPQLKDFSNSKRSKEESKASIEISDDTKEKWQCMTCTYLNSISNNVCEMCCKSKERGSELNPQPSGGPVCPKCTLVNEPGLSSCAACDSSLKAFDSDEMCFIGKVKCALGIL